MFDAEGVVMDSDVLKFNQVCRYLCFCSICWPPLLGLFDGFIFRDIGYLTTAVVSVFHKSTMAALASALCGCGYDYSGGT